jgi:glutamate 5-kinase
VKGKVIVDKGAVEAIRKRRSLLAVGVKTVLEKFESAEVFEILNEDMERIGVARAKIASDLIRKPKDGTGLSAPKMEIAHADDIVLL